jgi:hypothetical protein
MPSRQRKPRGIVLARGLGAVLTLGCAAIANQARADAEDAVLPRLMEQFAARTHGHASFVERQYLAVLERPIESSGELFYDAPDHLEKRTLLPKPESLILDHGSVTMHRGKFVQVLALRDYPQIAPFVDCIRATLAGDLAALEGVYTLSFEPAQAHWTLVLVPREARLTAVIARIRMAGSGPQIESVEFQRASGDRSVMTIRALPDP